MGECVIWKLLLKGGRPWCLSQCPVPGVRHSGRTVERCFFVLLSFFQVLATDIHLLSLLAYMEELSASFNTQDLAPDDFSSQDRFFTPCILYIHKDSHVLARLLTKQDILHFFLQLVSQDSAQELFRRTTIAPYFGVSRIEFQLCCLWIRLVSQGVACFHIVLTSEVTPWIVSMLHVFSSIIYAKTAKCLQGYTR
jgi:hypothetical protein